MIYFLKQQDFWPAQPAMATAARNLSRSDADPDLEIDPGLKVDPDWAAVPAPA